MMYYYSIRLGIFIIVKLITMLTSYYQSHSKELPLGLHVQLKESTMVFILYILTTDCAGVTFTCIIYICVCVCNFVDLSLPSVFNPPKNNRQLLNGQNNDGLMGHSVIFEIIKGLSVTIRNLKDLSEIIPKNKWQRRDRKKNFSMEFQSLWMLENWDLFFTISIPEIYIWRRYTIENEFDVTN